MTQMTQMTLVHPTAFQIRNLIPPVLPGIILCGLITAVSYGVEAVETALLGKAWLESLVLAILLGTAVRSFWRPGTQWHCGIAFSAKYLLEIAVVLLGASVSTAMIAGAGTILLIGISGVVMVAILLSFAIGKLLGLPTRMALLIACGNSICGNSAIAAVAPVIGADGDDVAASIAFTAVLGVVVVIGLPFLGVAIGLSGAAYGTFAGLTVYAVPQVIAAAAPMGVIAIQMGTLVKLVRVLMLGPVCLILSLIEPYIDRKVEANADIVAGEKETRARMSVFRLVPWFIIGFLVMVLCRSMGYVPEAAIEPIGHTATLLTVISMAALGLGVIIAALTACVVVALP